MKPEDKDLKQNEELNEEELDGVAGGQGFPFNSAATMQFQPGMQMGASTMEYRPGMGHMQAQTLEQPERGVNPANPVNPVKKPKNPGGVHSL